MTYYEERETSSTPAQFISSSQAYFTCPKCETTGQVTRWTITGVTTQQFTPIEMWQGGPIAVIDNDGELRVIDREVGTDVCDCTFLLSEWEVAIIYPDSEGVETETMPTMRIKRLPT